jgi:hypothetical protein
MRKPKKNPHIGSSLDDFLKNEGIYDEIIRRLTVRASKPAIDDLDWLLKSRARNQNSALALYALLRKYPAEVTKKNHSTRARALVGAIFSLWRAAFFADKRKTDQLASISSAEEFLERVILDNAINYTQERSAREWTFNYYAANCEYRSRYLGKTWPDILPRKRYRSPRERWEQQQTAVERALVHLTASIES